MQPFRIQDLPIINLNWERLSVLIGEANSKISLYNGLLEAIINPHILLSPLTTQEAVLSSKIEGTQASLAEVLEFEAGDNEKNTEKQNDITEIINYRKAMLEAEKLFKDRDFIHLNMLKQLHFILLSGVRGNNKARGEFRTIQNYIGSYGTTIERATYVPPAPENVYSALDNWEKYINSSNQEILVQTAFMHAQFELIHPFLDGNGRMGRMLIPLYLFQKKLLKQPVFYLSEYFEKNRELYYGRLKGISSDNDWQGWVEFFLKAIIEQASSNLLKAREILSLYDASKKDFTKAIRSKHAINILDVIFAKPVISSVEIINKCKIAYPTMRRIFSNLEKAGLISVIKRRGRLPNKYVFEKLIDIVEK